jgi:mitotic spindle assembly checkpoint protein MAD2
MVQKLVLVITSIETKQPLERWVFNIYTDNNQENGDKPLAEITKEIQALIRQITSSVTFLPLLDEACAFDLLVYTANNVSVPQAWEESDARMVENAQSVKLRSFNTSIHEVDGMVSYRLGSW